MDRLLEEFFDLDVIRALFPELITEAVRNTLLLTVLSFIGGMSLGLVLALMRTSRNRLLRWPAATFIDVFRGLPALLVIVFVGFGIPIASGGAIRFPFERVVTTPGVIALSMVAGAYIAETIRAGIEAVPIGQVEAARAIGLTDRQTMATVVLPQAMRIVVPPLTNELVLLFKDTALISALGTFEGGRELTKFARDATNRTANTSPLVAAGIAYLVITLPLIRLVAWLEGRRGHGSR